MLEKEHGTAMWFFPASCEHLLPAQWDRAPHGTALLHPDADLPLVCTAGKLLQVFQAGRDVSFP